MVEKINNPDKVLTTIRKIRVMGIRNEHDDDKNTNNANSFILYSFVTVSSFHIVPRDTPHSS